LRKLDARDRCRLTTDHARSILESMDDVDVAGSLVALRELGGSCDCAILYDLLLPAAPLVAD